MDPNACLKRIIDAITAQEWDEVEDACRDLYEWLKRGGFAPTAYNEPLFIAVSDGGGETYSILSTPDRPLRENETAETAKRTYTTEFIHAKLMGDMSRTWWKTTRFPLLKPAAK